MYLTGEIYLILLMFTEQLSFVSEAKRQVRASFPSKSKSEIDRITQADLEYEICGTFMKHTGQRLSARQSELMESSRQFIELYANFKKKEMDSSQTLDTYLEDITDGSIPIDEEQSFSLNRKKSSLFGSRKNLLVTNDHLTEIQQRCTLNCFNFFSSLVAEYKKIQSKIKQLETKQTNILKRQEHLEKLHEENIILKKKLQHQEQRIQQLHAQIQLLKEKNRSINSCINEKINTMNNNHKYFEINHKVYRDIKSYIQEKETILKLQSQHIRDTETKVLRAIEEAFASESCLKCCQILKKLKDSIIKFKKYLEGESQEFQRIYDKYKKTMYSVKARPSV